MVDTINDNITTDYLDIIPDSSLTVTGVSYGRSNTTTNYITIGGNSAMVIDQNLLAVGIDVGNPTGPWNTLYGYRAGGTATTGAGNVIIGYNSGYGIGNGATSVLIGYNTASSCNSLNSVTAVGYQSMGYTSQYDIQSITAIGVGTLRNVTGNYNTALGVLAGDTITSGASNVFLGYLSGDGSSQLATAIESIALGANSYTTKNYQCVLGSESITETLLRGHIILGQGATGIDYTLTFNGETNDGVITWMEDEAAFLLNNSVGIGKLPSTKLHVYDEIESCRVTIETDKENGVSSLRYTNDAQTWSTRINNSDEFQIRDVNADTARLTIDGSGLFTFIGVVKPSGYKSSDGSDGITQTISILDGDAVTTHDLTFKDGLLTAYSTS